MPRKQHIVWLDARQRSLLSSFVGAGDWDVRDWPRQAWAVQRARILLRADIGPEGWGFDWTDQQIAEAMDVTPRTVARARAAWCRQSWTALDRMRPHRFRHREVAVKLSYEQQAQLIAVARGQPPEGYDRWSLRLLAKRVVELGIVDSISHETVRKTLKKWRITTRRETSYQTRKL
jgi:transposase